MHTINLQCWWQSNWFNSFPTTVKWYIWYWNWTRTHPWTQGSINRSISNRNTCTCTTKVITVHHFFLFVYRKSPPRLRHKKLRFIIFQLLGVSSLADARPFYSLGVVSRAYIVCQLTFIIAMWYFFFLYVGRRQEQKCPCLMNVTVQLWLSGSV